MIVKEGDALLQNENFGPILPILQLEGGLEGAVDYIRKRYVFGLVGWGC